jgi:uncharacterized protein
VIERGRQVWKKLRGQVGQAAGALALCAMLAALSGCAASVATSGAREDVSPAARAETMQGHLFLFIYQAGPAWRAGLPMSQQGLGPHGAYIQTLLEQGRLFAGGGFTTSDGGMAVVVAKDIEEARAILAKDPAVTSGIFSARLEHWRPRFRSAAPLPRSD